MKQYLYNETSFYIAADIWYQLSNYARSGNKQVFAEDKDVNDFIEEKENDFSTGDESPYMSEQDMYLNGDISIMELLMILANVPGRRCDITLRGTSGNERRLCGQRISIRTGRDGETIYTATGIDGTAVDFSLLDISAIDKCST